MESTEPPPPEPVASGIFARIEQAMTRAGEHLLVEQLHRALDAQGPAGLAALSGTMLPLLQALVIVLPQALRDGPSPGVLAAARTLGLAAREQGIALPDLVDAGTHLHERLLQEVGTELRAEDRALLAAILRASAIILQLERAVLLAYSESEEVEPATPASPDAPPHDQLEDPEAPGEA